FIDRDGTLIKHVELLHKPEDLELYEFSSPALGKVNRSDYLCIMITNQSVVARNLCDITTIHSIHNKLETLLGMESSYLDDIYFCPHHPDSGYPGENPVYKTECECRKPKTGLIEKAVLRYNVDRESSWFIGDSTSDIQTGVNAGMNTILVRTGNGGKDGKYTITPDFVFNDLMEGVEFILEGKSKFDKAAKEIIKHVDLDNPLNIITIGGLARSGKSTFVKCLKDIFERQNITVTVVSLDNWLHGTEDRTDSMTVRERYRYKSIEEDMVKLMNEGGVQIRIYDSYSRTVKNGCSLTIKKPGVVIVEGVPALDIEGLRRISTVCIYCETDEQERRERFYTFYRWKNFTENQIEQLYDKRMSDEFPIIVNSKQYADIELYRDEIKVKRSL
ncbi:HAD-IIIA family hydrolase, partial [Candidatus Latescibacterota bacterium]